MIVAWKGMQSCCLQVPQQQRGGPQPYPQPPALCTQRSRKVCGIKLFFFLSFLSPRYMQGVVLAGVSSSQKPECVVGSLARICTRSLTRSEKPRTFVESSKFRCKWKFRQCSPVEVGNVPFSELARGVRLDEEKPGAAGPRSRVSRPLPPQGQSAGPGRSLSSVTTAAPNKLGALVFSGYRTAHRDPPQ